MTTDNQGPKPGDHNFEYTVARSDEPNYSEKVFGTGIMLEYLRRPAIIIASIDNQLVAFPADKDPDAVNFGAYAQDVLDWVQSPRRTPATPDLKAKVSLAFYNEATRRFEKAAT